MLPQVKKQEITANNVANAGATGFKKDRLFTKELTEAEKNGIDIRADWIKPMVSNVFVDHSPGVFDRTGNPLNLAIDGDGFFTLQLPGGVKALTRAGAFEVNSDGVIAFPGGCRPLDAKTPLTYPVAGALAVAIINPVQATRPKDIGDYRWNVMLSAVVLGLRSMQ